MSIQKNAKWWNNGVVNKRSIERPGFEFVQGRKKFKRKPATEDTKQKISKSLKGNTPWNKGKTNVYSEETIKKMSEAKEGYIPWNTNTTGKMKAWNKGLTADHPSVKKYSEKQKGQLRSGNYTFGENHPFYNPNSCEFKRYRQKVYLITEQNYRKYKNKINPKNHKRGLAGNDDVYHLDHKISIYNGFKNNIDPEIIGSVDNLQMLPWRENILKSK